MTKTPAPTDRQYHPLGWLGVLSVALLILVATVMVVAFRSLPTVDSAPRMVNPPAQDWIHTGPERQYLAELGIHVEDVHQHEYAYSHLGHVWCDMVQGGIGVESTLVDLDYLLNKIDPDPQADGALIAGTAALRLCPDTAGALDSFTDGW